MLEIQDSAESFGVARVLGADPVGSSEQADQLRFELARRGVLSLSFSRPLVDEEMQFVASLFGPIKDPVAQTKDGKAFRYSEPRQIIDSGFVMTDEVRAKLGDVTFGGLDDERPGLFETFHCDDTYTREPASATVLHARQLPPSGGGPTVFMDMRAAYTLLDEATRRRLDGLRVVYAYNNRDAFPPRRSASGPADALEEVTHPLVRTHPLAKTRSLFLDLDRATHIETMPVDDGRGLIRELQQHAEAHAPRCQHDWRDHDVLVWDNISVQHKAGGNFRLGESRRFWRYMVAGEQPV